MKYWKCLLLVGVLGFAGCKDPNETPQERASYMLDAQADSVRNAIQSHENRLPSDRNRWQESDVSILTNLYARLDDIYRQKQILAVDVGQQKYDPKAPLPQRQIEQVPKPR